MSRNNAFYKRVSDLDALKINIYSKNIFKRFWFAVKTICTLYFIKNRSILIHQGSLWILFPVFFMKANFFQKLVFHLLAKVSKNNKLTIEVNDLVYEQSIDLELFVDDFFSFLQQRLYTIKDCYYIFASHEMKYYTSKKYNILSKYSSVIINGAPELKDYSIIYNDEKWMESDKKKFVYAGSLNKGRQIEDLLTIFTDNEDNLLIVLGNEGEWLNEIKLPKNIIYLGNFEEGIAHYIVSKCDIGIIPYNENRFYYNLCFPTKVSFYITAGLPVLCTPLKELQNVFYNDDAILFNSFSNWKNIIKDIDKEHIIKMKKATDLIKKSYQWDFVLQSLKFE
ncbi:putative Glycosyltransferase [Flavobacterium aquidurense]|uniref:Putative Glycosyltransferase n=2 Tax=Flavobacterium aquidurense TaxID=362413 RepID=A0A0Q0XYL6_9FLAO|nr:putative Glycosyltransferase [Flavobacterium aquidurense]